VIWFYLALLVGILLGVVGQMLLKAGAAGDSLVAQFSAPQSIIGLAFYAAAAVSYMLALRKIPVSVAFPSVSLSYVLVVGAAYWLEDEPLGWGKLVGIALICSGVFLVARQA
jgi:multidrug transporter EmrE-like cation transporter